MTLRRLDTKLEEALREAVYLPHATIDHRIRLLREEVAERIAVATRQHRTEQTALAAAKDPL
jgi:hypothetical protein